MRKKYFLIIFVILLLIAFFYIFLISPNSAFNGSGNLQNGENNSTSFRLPREPEKSPQEPSGGGTGIKTGGGSNGLGETNITPSIKQALDIESTPSGFSIITFYYSDGNFTNVTQSTPYSLNIDDNTTVCLAESTGYSGIWWQVDEMPYNMSKCYGYSNGCLVLMNQSHVVRLRQNS